MYEEASKANDGWLFESEAHGILARAEAAIRKVCGDESPYTTRMETVLEKLIYNDRVKAGLIVGIVKALKGDLEDGYLQTLPELVRAEMFENFNEMARHLLEEGYKDAAAVIGSASLESHLHRLAMKHGIQLGQTGRDRSIKHKKANQLNQELHKSGAYSLFDQKQLTVWLDLRNNAAHGKYDAYDKDQVSKLIEWVGDFIAKNPA